LGVPFFAKVVLRRGSPWVDIAKKRGTESPAFSFYMTKLRFNILR